MRRVTTKSANAWKNRATIMPVHSPCRAYFSKLLYAVLLLAWHKNIFYSVTDKDMELPSHQNDRQKQGLQNKECLEDSMHPD